MTTSRGRGISLRQQCEAIEELKFYVTPSILGDKLTCAHVSTTDCPDPDNLRNFVFDQRKTFCPDRACGGIPLELTREKAEHVLCQGPWLAHMSAQFRTELLRQGHLQKFSPDQIIYRYGDAAGGMYGLVAGSLTINSAPPDAIPRLIHLGMAGAWTGEGPFLTGQPRRVELRALGETWMMHVPLDALEQMAARDPAVWRAVGLNTVLTVDVLVRIIHDLQKRNVECRIASVLQRAGWLGDMAIPLSQSALGVMANASRQQVNSAMKSFARAGWVKYTYRSVTILDTQALRRFSDGDGSE